jgi:isoquinoline 1-oxidoreductase subunit beta
MSRPVRVVVGPSVYVSVISNLPPLDAGLVVNPEVTRAQFEGAAVFGTSVALSGEITAKNGVIEQSNFNDYPVAHIDEAPR